VNDNLARFHHPLPAVMHAGGCGATVIASEATQSSACQKGSLDYFAALAMTVVLDGASLNPRSFA